MKLNKKSLREITSKLLKSYIFEAEEKEEPAKEEGGEEDANPFAAAAAGDEEGGDEEAPTDDAKADDKEKAPAKAEEPKGIPIKFNVSRVKKYNNANFVSDSGVLKSIDKRGMIVTTQPDGVDVLVNFDDISENVKKFFKSKK
jgi:hypothetical protein